jgi:hypothetical protein
MQSSTYTLHFFLLVWKNITEGHMLFLYHVSTNISNTASQILKEIHRGLWNLKVHYHVHNSLPLVLILCQTNRVHTLLPYFCKTNFSIILLCIAMPSTWPFTFKFSFQNFVHISLLSHMWCLPHPSHPPWFHHPTNIEWSKK